MIPSHHILRVWCVPPVLTGLSLARLEYGETAFAASPVKPYRREDPTWGNHAFTKAPVEDSGGKTKYNRAFPHGLASVREPWLNGAMGQQREDDD